MFVQIFDIIKGGSVEVKYGRINMFSDNSIDKFKFINISIPSGNGEAIISKASSGKVKELKNHIDARGLLQNTDFRKESKEKLYLNHQIKACPSLNKSLDRVYMKVLSSEEAAAIASFSPPPVVFSSPPAHIEVLAGNNNFYIGARLSDLVIKKSHNAFVKGSDIKKSQIRLPAEPHLTIVPPSPGITPLLCMNKLAEVQRFDLQLDRISISPEGNVSLWAKQSEAFSSASSIIAEAVGGKENSRGAHAVVGILSPALVDQIFAEPRKYGFEKEENDKRLYKKVDPPIQQVFSLPRNEYTDDQLLLKKEHEGAKPLSNEEVAKARQEFNLRLIDVKNQQKGIQIQPYHMKKNDLNREEIPFNYPKLLLAIEGDKKLGRIPLTFSCRENGVALWNEFCKDVKEIVEHSRYDDIKVQIIGSGVHGFTRNPTKKLKGWDFGSDGDFAIFSKKISVECAKEGVQVNQAIQLNGKFMVYKNERDADKEGIGFHDMPIGKRFRALQEKWSEKLFGAERSIGKDIDFKMNINPKPFNDAIEIF